MTKENLTKQELEAQKAIKLMAQEAETESKNTNNFDDKSHLEHFGDVDNVADEASSFWWLKD